MKYMKQNDVLQKKIVIKGTKEYSFTAAVGSSLMSVINSHPNCDYAFPCGGNGKCGKCVIRVLEGFFDITANDRSFFSDEMLKNGYRLACSAVVSDDCVIEFKGAVEKKYDVLSAFVQIRDYDTYTHGTDGFAKGAAPSDCNGQFAIAVDIGTTTIAVSLIEAQTGNVVNTYTALNRQRRYGADVISRIQASNDGKGKELQQSIREDLLNCMDVLIKDHQVNPAVKEITQIVISGNTTMGHLLLGYSCETLGVYPFTPVDITGKTLTFEEVFGSRGNKLFHGVLVYIVPGISTYVGGDIAAGILHCDIINKKEISLLIDLGTNGEMAIGNQDKLLVTSTAAGPAFEGGNISCGTGSIDGAVCDVEIEEDNVKIKTINDKPLSGICGTGVIAITAQLLKNELVDETGRFDDEYFEKGFILGETKSGETISFTQKDVREIQLAKAAIRAGAETLIRRYGIGRNDVAKVYIAGGFGYHIDLNNAIAIGLLAEEFNGRIAAVGNSSLGGAVELLRHSDSKKEICKICDMAEEISLSEDRDFQEFYMDYMMFEED